MTFEIVNKDLSLETATDYTAIASLIEDLTGYVVRDEGLYLNVKNKGMISANAWNSIAEPYGFADDYEMLERINANLIQNFYDVSLQDNEGIEWGKEVYTTGRSAGYWGFTNDFFDSHNPILTVKDSVEKLVEAYVLFKLEAAELSFDTPVEELIEFFEEDSDLYGAFILDDSGNCTVDFANIEDLFYGLMAEEEDLSVYFELAPAAEDVLSQFIELIEVESKNMEDLANGYDEMVISMLETEAENDDDDDDDDYLFESKKKLNESDEPNDRMLLTAINQILEEDLNFLGKLEVVPAQGPKGTMYHIDLSADLELVGNAATAEWVLQFRKGMLGIDGLRYLQKEVLRKLLPAMDKLTAICEHYK